MATSDSGIDSQSSPELSEEPPMSRTHQYRHMIKPLLERKRRARINKCLDELKDLMVSALQKDGESITKLEKADVLELTVRHLRKLKSHGALGLRPSSSNRYLSGYSYCSAEISKYIASGASGLDANVSGRLLHHLSSCIRGIESHSPAPLVMSPSPTLSILPSLQSSHVTPPTNLSEYFSQSKVEALRFSLGHHHSESDVSSSSKQNIVKAEVALVPTSDKEDDKAWRPWNSF